ncbi:ATP-binding protein [Fulvivirgaceae bacterium BMA10]|uniref:ATP-binding protein n=1 Tax=Splendidivirga corallicola TaxID=3051826 RepID=A0ABT8KLB1_9BACT|nr:ATP-binding protein [Fulvivirgaceae bacterium BMA10]
MFFIRSFCPSEQQLGGLHQWIDKLRVDEELISKLKLRLLLVEAFVNAYESGGESKENITIIIEQQIHEGHLNIMVTDNGRGFDIDGAFGNFEGHQLGKRFLIVAHPGVSLYAIPMSPNKLRFKLIGQPYDDQYLPERNRGILAMLNIATTVEYQYCPFSNNYLKISISKEQEKQKAIEKSFQNFGG